MSKTRKVPSLILLAAASIALMFGVVGCGKNDTQQTSAQNQPAQTDQSQDPAAAANLAPTDATQATGTNQQQPASQPAQQTYQQPANQPAQQPAPSDQSYQQPAAAQDQNYSNNDYDTGDQDTNYGQPVLQAQQPRHRSQSIRSRIYRAKAICGHPDIGATLLRAITGCLASGRSRRRWASCGHPDTGDSSAAGIATITDTGADISVTTAGLTMETATLESVIKAATGAEIVSPITVPSTM